MKKKYTKLYEWQEKCKDAGVCTKCGKIGNLTVDHIIPASLVQQFMIVGEFDATYNYEENFEILCIYCNRIKGHRIDPRNPKVYEILEKLLQEAKKQHLGFIILPFLIFQFSMTLARCLS